MDIYRIEVPTADGGRRSLADFRGQVLLIVNSASECGFTPQYEGLEQLQRQYASRGFSVLAFPCNQFGGQEPGTDEQIQSFCSTRFQVSFPVFAKVEVNGDNAHPLFRLLKTAAPGVLGSEAIKWNFTKFLISRQGEVVDRFAPTTAPDKLVGAINELL